MSHYLDEKNVEVLTKNNVLSESELHSRYEIYLEKYYKTINIEALCMLDMLKKDIIPAVSAFEKELLSTLISYKETGLYSEDLYETGLIRRIDSLKKGLSETIIKTEESLEKVPGSSALQKAFYYHDVIIPLMDKMRSAADELEKITDRQFWPFPTYLELLFGVD